MKNVVPAAATIGALLLACVAPALAQTRESGIQCTSDNSAVLVNKDVNGERWVITFRKSNGFTTGNVLGANGSVTFLSCNMSSIQSGQVMLSCGTSGSCDETSCPQYQGPIEASVNCGFFSAPCAPIPGNPGGTNQQTCAGSPPKFPYDSEESCAQYAASAGCGTFLFEPGSCWIHNCCSLPDACPP